MARLKDDVYEPIRGEPRGLRRPLPRVRPAARLLRPRRERRHEGAPGAARPGEGAAIASRWRPDASSRRSARSSSRCTPSCRATGWWSGPAATSAPATRRPGLVAIKPSGVRYEDLTAESMVVLDLDGAVVEGALKPSSDTASHLYIYRHRPDVNGVVHTHSRYATAFAAVGRPIPVYLTAQADEFGGEIPCAGFALIGDEAIGALVVEGIGRSPAILLKNHGVFTIGPTAEAAVKAAVMVEDVAATRLGGAPDRRPRRPPRRRRRRGSTSATRRATASEPTAAVVRQPSTSAPTRSGSSPAASTSTAPRRSRPSPSTRRRSPRPSTPRRRSRSGSSSSRS